jgi:hypothetical protein
MRVVCLEEFDVFAPMGKSMLRWYLLETKKDDKPVVRLHNFKGKPMTICRHIHFSPLDSCYYGEVYGECFHLPLEIA